MEYLDNTRSSQLKNYGQWFQDRNLSQYRAARTVLQTQFINNAESIEKKPRTNHYYSKGFQFLKAQKPQLFLTPANHRPAFYDLAKKPCVSIIEDKQKQSMSRNKSNRFQNNSQETNEFVGVGAYNVTPKLTNKKYKQMKIGKGEKISYFQQAMFQGIQTPSPGQYLNRHQKSKSQASLEKNMNPWSKSKQKKAKRSRSIGPGSYQVQPSLSVGCVAVMKKPYKQKDQKMKQKLKEWKKSKQNLRNPDPGKYIKIEEWGKFEGNKQISNGLKTLAKPSLKIYK